MSESTRSPLAEAIATDNVPELCSLLEKQDHQLYSELAQCGSPQMAEYLLSRHSVSQHHSQRLSNSHPTKSPHIFLILESPCHGNVSLFRYLLSQESILSSLSPSQTKLLLRNAIRGGVDIWTVLLENNPFWKDYEAPGHLGTVLEWTVELKAKQVLAYLLEKGADVQVLEGTSPRALGADEATLDLIAKYQAMLK